MERVTIEVWACIDADGGYEVGTTADEARGKYEENIGDMNNADGIRLVHAKIEVPRPSIINLSGTVAADADAAALFE